MCGILGVVHKNNCEISSDYFFELLNTIQRRGPDKKDLDGGRFCSIPKSWVNKIWYLDKGKEYENVRVQLMGKTNPKGKNRKGVQ